MTSNTSGPSDSGRHGSLPDPATASAAAPDPRGATSSPQRLDAHSRFVRFHDWFIDRELPFASSFLPDDERQAFLGYYESVPRPEDVSARARFLRGLWRSEVGWVARWIARRPVPPRILDAGCGFGTFSMLFAAMGAEVTGVDLRPDRLDAGERRLALYRQRTGESLPVRYERADVTQPRGDRFDMVWVYNALSHIEPVAGFLTQMRSILEPQGLLVIGEINGEHPHHARHLAQLRTEVHQEYVAPDGARYAYAVEQSFSPGSVRNLVRAHGFRIVRHELFFGGLGILPDALYVLLKPLQHHAGWNGRFALRQSIVVTPD